VNDAVTLGETKQWRDLLFARVGAQFDAQANLLKTDEHISGHAQCATKIKVAFGANFRVTQRNAESSSYCAQCDACASDQRFEQHVGGTCALPIAASRRMKSRFNTRFSGFDFAGHVFAETSLG